MTKSWHLLHSYCFTGGSWRTEPFSQTIIAPHEGQFIILYDNLKITANISLFDINFYIVTLFYNLIRISCSPSSHSQKKSRPFPILLGICKAEHTKSQWTYFLDICCFSRRIYHDGTQILLHSHANQWRHHRSPYYHFRRVFENAWMLHKNSFRKADWIEYDFSLSNGNCNGIFNRDPL